MNSSFEQPHSLSRKTGGRGEHTRRALLHAAAELIAEVGWDRATTRAIAERANLPLGTVSYHFQGKQELLTEAALRTVEQMFPIAEIEALETLEELLALIRNQMGDRGWMDSVGVGVMMEAMRESERNPALRGRIATLLRDYRRAVAELVRSDRQRSGALPEVEPSALATLIIAASDGLLLHALLDSELEVVEAIEALIALLRTEPGN